MKIFILKVSIITTILIATVAGIITLSILYFSSTLPKIETLADYNPPIPSQIISRDGHVLATIGSENRDIVQLPDVPERIIGAFLSAEDDNFFHHKGVDYSGIARAMFANLKAGRVVQGGSTITQQVAKSLLLSSERSFGRKIKDFLLAMEIEKKFTKDEILFLYLNQVYLGRGAYGIKEAFRSYYGKELKEVTNAEAAMVAGLLVAPGRYSPHISPKLARMRQEYVLRRMYDTKKISKEEYAAALEEREHYRIKDDASFKAPYFTEKVRQKVVELFGEERLTRDGFKIMTTLDWKLQQVAEKSLSKGLRDIDKRQGYSGAVSTLKNQEDLLPLLKKQRRKILADKSQFFTIGQDYQHIYEIEASQLTFEKAIEFRNNKANQFPSEHFEVGMSESELFYSLFDKETLYEAVITKVDDVSKLVFVNHAGVPGIIPFNGYSWLHQRSIKEHPNYPPQVSKPSQFLKAGDIIYVAFTGNTEGFVSHLTKEAKVILKGSYEKFKNEKYLVFNLEQKPEVQGSLLSLSAETGEVLSYVAGSDYSKSKFDRITLSKRQPGSSFKPFIYAAALENGYTPSSILIDTPEALSAGDNNKSWKPSNYDNTYKGPITLRNCLEQSRNIPTIRLADSVGISNLLEFSKRVGLKAKLERDLSLSLGTFGVTLKDLMTAYAIFPNGGKMIDAVTILSVKDRYGNTFTIDESDKLKTVTDPSLKEEDKIEITKSTPYTEGLKGNTVYDPRLAYIMTHLLQGVVWHGTAAAASSVSRSLAGKTGTTNNFVDAWFTGFSPRVVAGVWVGFDDNKPLGYGETGARSALPIWMNYMSSVVKTYGDEDFRVPQGLSNVAVNRETGEPGGNFIETFVSGTEPGSGGSKRYAPAVEGAEKAPILEDDYYNQQ